MTEKQGDCGGIGRRRAMRLVIQLPQAEDTRKAWTVARAKEVGKMFLRYFAPQSASGTSLKDYMQGANPCQSLKTNR